MLRIALNENEYKLCEFCTISPTISFFSEKFVHTESVLTFELAIQLVCSINLKK